MKLFEIYNQLNEASDYATAKEMDDFLRRRMDSMGALASKKYNDFYDKIVHKYGTTLEKKYRKKFKDSKSSDFRDEYFTALDRILKLLTPDEMREEAKVRKMLFGTSLKSFDSMPQKASTQYLTTYQKFTSKFKDAYGLQGDLKSKYAYHLTNADRLLDILHDDALFTGENGGVSLSTFKNLIKRKPIFYHGEVDYTTIGAQIVLNLPKIIKDKYKIIPGSDDDDNILGTVPGEEELSIRSELKNVHKYIIKVVLFANHIELPDFIKLTSELKNRNIPYYLNKKVNYQE